MTSPKLFPRFVLGLTICCVLSVPGCKSGGTSQPAPAQPPFMSAVAGSAPSPEEAAPPPEKTGGFDGHRAYEQVAKQVSFGPRPAGSPALAKLQDYLESELKSYGCTVESDAFSADTPAGRLPMKNILVKIPGEKPGIILLGTHYDTKRLDDFVGADDGGSSTGVMLEIARLLCAEKQRGKYAVWIAFFDGEEAVNPQWQDPDHTYGSRELAARMAMAGELAQVKAFLLADIVGGKARHFKKEDGSTKWLVDLVWSVAARLGYSQIFLNEKTSVGGDDHFSFTSRGVPSVDVITPLTAEDLPYWHTPQDTMDKISPKTLSIVGHTILASVQELQKK
jgi:Zn-dependent M28 family amino/carboxypeptidase